ncbi:hypothetical protein AKJ47_01855 [candidate division MSBL1 archaeon SCGC-AAA261G05]|uniref:4Fe-4S ferredoxin-type domain-containing protein n=2 Tax=candidate division MSBL1 TaxID=215777 RepID=A0A133V141_9EURY|nr:hypothetical protein AKJ42_01495 [candidate division MSBL1 archaeon SCGC-AAA261C02]KXB03638.1 hypothetical protein AKJ47_01855 [candidate division MSBL1 archaeon SCGC-AAA261G05]
MSKIAWGITGAGDFLPETFEIMEELANNHKLTCYVSKAGERVIHIYGFWDKLKELCPGDYYQEIILESEQGPSFSLTGRLQRGKYSCLIISPATANTVSKIVVGIADTLVPSAFAQAGKGEVPVLIVPTDQGVEKVSRLPPIIHKEVCREKIEEKHKECLVINLCPYGAIKEVEGLPKINLTLCEGCGICKEKCPYGAVTIGEETKVNVREIDRKNVEKLKEFENLTVLEKPDEIPRLLGELTNES